MIQEKDLPKLSRYLEGLGIIIPDKWPEGPEFWDADGLNVHRLNKENEVTFTYRMNLHRDDGYRVDGYEAIMTRIPEIRHIETNSGNSTEVEKILQKINWQGLIPELIRERPDAVLALLALSKLANENHSRAQEVADQLLGKYILGTPMQAVLGPIYHLDDYEKKIEIELNGNADDINTDEARNLLYGRAVSRIDHTKGPTGDALYWIQEKDGKLFHLPDFGLEEKLRTMPFTRQPDVSKLYEMVMQLSSGARIERSFLVDGTTFRAGFQADPNEGKIVFSDRLGNKLSLQEAKDLSIEEKKQHKQDKRNGPKL